MQIISFLKENIILLPVTVLVTWLLIGELRLWQELRMIDQDGVIVEASVRTKTGGRSRHEGPGLVYTFTTTEGVQVLGRSYIAMRLWRQIEEGDTVSIAYVPERPEISRVEAYDNTRNIRRFDILVLSLAQGWCLLAWAVKYNQTISLRVSTLLRGTNRTQLWKAHLALNEAGINVPLEKLEAHLLAGGDLGHTARILIDAKQRGESLSAERAMEIDRDRQERVQ